MAGGGGQMKVGSLLVCRPSQTSAREELRVYSPNAHPTEGMSTIPEGGKRRVPRLPRTSQGGGAGAKGTSKPPRSRRKAVAQARAAPGSAVQNAMRGAGEGRRGGVGKEGMPLRGRA